MTDAEITIAMAEVEGWTDIAMRVICEGTGMKQWLLCSGVIGKSGRSIPDYLTDANAVRRVLEKFEYVDISCDKDVELGFWSVAISQLREGELFIGIRPTFCRAACIAILRAHGKWREEPFQSDSN